MNSPQDCRHMAAAADAVADDDSKLYIARAVHRSLARTWRYLAAQKEWLDHRPSLDELREPGTSMPADGLNK